MNGRSFRHPSNLGPFVCLLMAASAPAASAQTEDELEARRLFDQGVAAVSAGEPAAAADAFAASHALFPHPGTLKNLAAAQEAAGRTAEAWASWSELLERYGEVVSEATRAEAHGRVEALDARLATVEIRVDPAEARVFVDDRELGVAPSRESLRLAPGEVRFAARLEGRVDAETVVTLQAGPNPPVVLVLPPLGPPRGTVRVESPTPGATATIDGGAASSVPLAVEVDPGEHEVRLEAPGCLGRTDVVVVEAGGELLVAYELSPVEVTPPEDGDGGFWSGPWPWILGGVVVAGAAAGLTAGLLVESAEPVPAEWRVRTP